MPVILLNDAKVASLKPHDARVEYFDRGLPGFGVRVTSTGIKSFVLLYRLHKQQRRMTIGRYPAMKLAAARKKAREALADVTNGHDPALAHQEAQAHTFGALAARFIEKHAKPRKRSWRGDARMIRADLKAWHHRPVGSLRRADVRALLERIIDRGAPTAANRVLALVRKIFNYGIDQDWVEANPAQRMAMPANETSRSRVLKADELRVLWAWLERPAPETFPPKKTRTGPWRDLNPRERATEQKRHRLNQVALKLRLLTAQRGAEVLAMRWEDLDGAWWTVPAEVAKNGLSHRVPLSTPALAVIETVRAENPTGTLFKGIAGTVQRRGTLDGVALDDVRPHDFRRTAASMMAGAGVHRLVISKVLNHAETGVTAIYDRHSYDAEKTAALELWADLLVAILTVERV